MIRGLGALALLAVTLPPVVVTGAPEPPVDLGAAVADPALVQVLATTPATARVAVEIVSADTSGARRAARDAGGFITGSVPGHVVQASLPAGRVAGLAQRVDHVRAPLVANRPVTQLPAPGPADLRAAGFGAVAGQHVPITGATAWHDAGLTGAVRVGIVDFFDLGRWNEAEMGPLPGPARRLCLDASQFGYCTGTPVDGSEHGLAVAEVLKDVAPGAELFLATVGTASELRAAVDWFAANGVAIVTRSLGAAYDGPGDGSGPLAAVVDHATALGITWFNSTGNDAAGRYGRFTDGVDAAGFVDFRNGPGVDTTLTVHPSPSSGCLGFDGIRWSDWGLPRARVTDYAVDVFDASGTTLLQTIDARQRAGAPPLEAVDVYLCGTVTLRIRRLPGGDRDTDVVEVALFDGVLEHNQAPYSAAKPVVDSRSPALVAVGAVDPPGGPSIAPYSSQGPTNDGRTKPDMSAPSCLATTIYTPPVAACFAGTSAAAPAAAGVAALLLGAGMAVSGAPLAALTRHLVVDLGPPGRDDSFGAGRAQLPAPPVPLDSRPAAYTPVEPVRLLDTRPASATPGARLGPFPPYSIVDLGVPAPGATAAALSIVSTDTTVPGYVQAVPTMAGLLAGSSTLNVAAPGDVQPNFAVVPLGAGGSVSLFLFAGGNVVVDLLGWFRPVEGPVAAGRFVAVDPVRVLDTRPESPVPAGRQPGKVPVGGTVVVSGVPPGAAAAVVNVAADQADGPGFLRTQPTGAGGLTTSNGNYREGLASATLSVVPVGADGTISVFSSNSTHVVVDLLGYVTGPTAAPGSDGLFVPVTPTRLADTRAGAGAPITTLTGRAVQVAGTSVVPAGASAVSFNLTADQADGAGYVTVHPVEQPLPVVSNLNHPPVAPRANAGMVRLGASGTLDAFANRTTHVIIDVNGYFTGPS